MLFLKDTQETIKRYEMLFYTTLFRFLIRYRQTILGPAWVLIQPLAFVLFLGALLVGLSGVGASVFIPHLTIGYVAWILLGGFLTRGPAIFSRNQAYIIDGNGTLTDAVMLDNLDLIVRFFHQVFLIFMICIYYKTTTITGALWAFLGLLIIIFNGYIYSVIVAIIGARFQDLNEAVVPISSILFLTTPIIWMPSSGQVGRRVEILQVYMNFNPFFHFLEIFRAPLLSNSVSQITLYFVGTVTVIGVLITIVMYKRFHGIVPHWLR